MARARSPPVRVFSRPILNRRERFGQIDSTLGRKYEGTGLGLPLVKSLMELHGGSLHIASKLHAGTTVTATLPASRCLEPEPARAVA